MPDIDRNIAIKGLESLWSCISPVSHSCGDCPERNTHVECKRRVIEKAITILQEQETVKQEAYENGFHDGYSYFQEQEPVAPVCTEYDRAIVLFSCRDCKTQLLYGQRYCHMCGRKVKWND